MAVSGLDLRSNLVGTGRAISIFFGINGVRNHQPFQVLMYGSARVAEEVCHLNRWDKCFLPINALETALELRQLDTLSFFLRSKESGRG